MRGGVIRDALAPAPQGLGLSERTPEYRFLWSLGQMALDASEPGIYAAQWARIRQTHGARVLLQNVPSDAVVPAACGVTLARCAGLVAQLAEEIADPIGNDIYMNIDRNTDYQPPSADGAGQNA